MSGCERYELMISALLDGELDEREKAELSAHIAGCEHCAAMAAAFAAVSGTLAESFEEPPGRLHGEVMEKIGDAARVKRGQNRFMRLRPIIAAAACIAVVVVTLLAANHGIRGAENTGVASGNNTEVLTTESEAPAYVGGAEGSAATSRSAGAGGENGDAAPMEVPVPIPASNTDPAGMAMDDGALGAKSVADTMDTATAEETAAESEFEEEEAEHEPDAPAATLAALPELEVEAVAAGDGSFTATVLSDPGGYFAPGTTLTVLSDEAAAPGTRVMVRYSGVSAGEGPDDYCVTAEEIALSE